jgi:hypothetical protein
MASMGLASVAKIYVFSNKREMKDADVCRKIFGTFLHPSFPSFEAKKHRFFLQR